MVKQKVLLLNPPGQYVREECALGARPTKYLPCQIFLAGSYLLKLGKDVVVIDAQTQKIPDFSDFDIVVVWVSLFDSFYSDIEYLRKAKEQGRITIIILNDQYGVEMEVMQRYSFIDYLVLLYEREIVLGKIIDSIENSTKVHFPGVIYRNPELVSTGPMHFLPNLDHLPSHVELLKKLPLEKYGVATVTTGKGCPMVCTFCYYSQSGCRKRQIPDLIRELKVLSAVKEIEFHDLNMTANLKWTNEFLDALIESGNKKEWFTDVRADVVSLELMSKFKKAGCRSVMIGVESINKDILEKVKKRTNPEMIENAIKTIQKAGLLADTSWIIGFPWDSEETMQEMYDFLKKLHTVSFGISYMMPIKGTKLYEDFKAEGIIQNDITFEDYVNARFDVPMYPTKYLSREDLIRWNKKFQRLRFSPKYMTKYVSEGRFSVGQIGNYVRKFCRSR